MEKRPGTFIQMYDPRNSFKESAHYDSMHSVFDADLGHNFTLHRFYNKAGVMCSAIYHGDDEIWWTYTDGNEEAGVGDEEAMIKEWKSEDRAYYRD